MSASENMVFIDFFCHCVGACLVLSILANLFFHLSTHWSLKARLEWTPETDFVLIYFSLHIITADGVERSGVVVRGLSV